MTRYRRDRVTWAAFGGLFAFGFLNAALGPVLPYLRAEEGLSYVAGALHQAAFALGGGLAGLLAAWRPDAVRRVVVIVGGLSAAAVAALGLGFGRVLVVTALAAFAMSLFGTSALIRIWAVVADRHGAQRTRAMTEGEVAVSLAGIVTALAVGGLAATALTWRAALVLGGVVTVATALGVVLAGVPAPETPMSGTSDVGPRRLSPTLVVVLGVVAVEYSLSLWLASYLNEDVGLSRSAAASMVGALYTANLVGRLLASRVAGRRVSDSGLLGGSLLLCLLGLPVLLLAGSGVVAAVGIAVVGAATGAMFPLISSLHVSASPRSADHALGEILLTAAAAQVLGPLCVGALATAAGLRIGLVVLPVLVVVAAIALHRAVGGEWSGT